MQTRLEPFFTKARSKHATTLVLGSGLLPLALGDPVAVVLGTIIAIGFLPARSKLVRDAWDTAMADIYGRAVLGATTVFGLGYFVWGHSRYSPDRLAGSRAP